MRDFQTRGKFARLLQSKPALVFLGLLLLVSVWNLIGFWRKMNETGENRERAEERVAELTENKMKLEANIESLESDRGIEEVLREDYGLSREGEGVIVIMEDQSEEVEEEPQGFFGWWKNLFK